MKIEIWCPECYENDISGENDFGYICKKCGHKFYNEDLS